MEISLPPAAHLFSSTAWPGVDLVPAQGRVKRLRDRSTCKAGKKVGARQYHVRTKSDAAAGIRLLQHSNSTLPTAADEPCTRHHPLDRGRAQPPVFIDV